MLLNDSAIAFLTRVSADIIFGTIVLSAVLGSLSDPFPSNGAIILTTILSLQVISWGRAYAAKIRTDMEQRRVSPWSKRWRLFFQLNWMMVTTVVPFVFFGCAALGLITQHTAFLASEIVLLAILMFFGFVSRRISGGGVMLSVLTAAGVTLLGYIAIQVKVWSRHLPTLGF